MPRGGLPLRFASEAGASEAGAFQPGDPQQGALQTGAPVRLASEAGASEADALQPQDAALVTDVAAAQPEANAPQPDAGAPQPDVPEVVLLSQEMLPQVRELARQRRVSRGNAHDQVREALNIVASGGPGAAAPNWAGLPWMEYIALHPRAADLVGPGIVEIFHAFIEGTLDPNRMGIPRCDFVLQYPDGGYVRIHPGSRPRSDATPLFFPPPVLLSPALQWASLLDGAAFTEVSTSISGLPSSI